MKSKKIWWILFGIGIIPFVFPFLNFGYEMLIASSWTLIDWLVCYTFVYWPTYVVGFILVLLSLYKLNK